MGIFTKKKIVVSSVVYNMAGDEADRPDYLKSLVVRNILSGTKDSMSDTFHNGYLYGPAMRFRSFYRWASQDENYDQVGLPSGSLQLVGSLDGDVVAPFITPGPGPGQDIWVQTVVVGPADPDYWAEQWVLENRPADYDLAWTADYNEAANEITVTFPSELPNVFTPVDFNYTAQYVYAYYNVIDKDIVYPLVTGDTITLDPEDDFPDTDGWNLDDDTTSTFTGTLTKVTDVHTHVLRSYSDGRPDEIDDSDAPTVTTTTPYSYEDFSRTYSLVTDISTVPNQVLLRTQTMYQEQDGSVDTVHSSDDDVTVETSTITGGVTLTTTTTVTTVIDEDKVVLDRSYRIDTQDTLYRDYGYLKLWIYRLGSGIPDLDAAVAAGAEYGEFFPFIPVRLDNKFLSEDYLPDAFAQVKKAYKKATGGAKFAKLIDKLEDNDDLDKIDYAYVTFGVSLNVVENACKKYIYTFFRELGQSQSGGLIDYEDWRAYLDTLAAMIAAWNAWKANPASGPEPPRPSFASEEFNGISIRGDGPVNSNYDTRITWSYIIEGSGSGLAKPEAKRGELWFATGDVISIPNYIYGPGGTTMPPRTIIVHRLYWQKTEDSHVWLDIVGATFHNYIYKGKSVTISIQDALDDPDDSGFIVPLHYDTWRSMSLIDTTQMATACVFIVFNCYQVYKTKWYQSWIFRIILVIVIAIISVFFPGGFTAVGILGSNIAVGSYFGFTGVMAAIVGSITNALAALVLATLLETVTRDLGILGPIVSTLLMFVIGQVSSSFTSTGVGSIDWAELLKVDNLMKLLDALGNGFSNMLMDEIRDLQKDATDFAKRAQQAAKKIQQAYFDELGYGAGQIDPYMFVDALSGPIAESSETFLTRTLMTGSDISDMSMDLLHGFTELSLNLPDAFS